MKSALLAIVGGASTALAAVRGFNYASQGATYESFAGQFRTAAGLAGANDFSSARLYTMIQDGTTNTPISAIKAAIDTKTTLLLGLWASQGQAGFDNELSALKNAAAMYGTAFADLVQGISVGSEDLYRISPTGIAANSGIGQSPDTLVSYIGQVREAIKGTSLASKPVGHVDTWNVYVNGSNANVISACDFLGLDEYPYFQTTDSNGIENGKTLFFEAYDKVARVAGGRPIWITEAGWPVSGPTSNLAVASVENAETFWQDVSCELQRRNIDFWWYILADSGASPSFGVSENGQPLYNLVCNAPSSSSSSSSSNPTSGSSPASSSSSSQVATVAGGSGSGSGNGSSSGSSTTSAPGSAGTGNAGATATGAPTLSTSWAASKTPTANAPASTSSTAAFPGAAGKVEASFAALVVAAFAALAM